MHVFLVGLVFLLFLSRPTGLGVRSAEDVNRRERAFLAQALAIGQLVARQAFLDMVALGAVPTNQDDTARLPARRTGVCRV